MALEELAANEYILNINRYAFRITLAIKRAGLTIVDELGTNIHPNIAHNI